MSELFTIPESKSPRLQWMEKHGIEVSDGGRDYEHGDECAETGQQLYRFMAHGKQEGSGFGVTADDAILDYARTAGFRLWNEEGQP